MRSLREMPKRICEFRAFLFVNWENFDNNLYRFSKSERFMYDGGHVKWENRYTKLDFSYVYEERVIVMSTVV